MASPLLHGLVRSVGQQLNDLSRNDTVLVGCSGGADSLALAAIAARVATAGGPVAGAVVVDHQLQPGSPAVADQAASQCAELGLADVKVVPVNVDLTAGEGMEAAARRARRAALIAAAAESGARAVLLAHTLDDQAETVLLRLSRGAGSRSLSAMAPSDGVWRRPLLSARRTETAAVCAELGLRPHVDPHNSDPAYARVRVRHDALPALVAALGDAVVTNLARTAHLCRADNEALDMWADAQADARLSGNQPEYLSLAAPGPFDALPTAVRRRVIRVALIAGGCPPGSLTAHHVEQVDLLAVGPRGRGPTRVPGDIEVARDSEKLVIQRAKPLGSSSSGQE